MDKTIVATLLVALSAIVANSQTFDNSGNGALSGSYFVRELMFSNVNVNGDPTTAQSAIGAIMFDGKGNYTFNGQVMKSGNTSPSTMSLTGVYKCSGNHLLKMQSLFPNTATDGNAADLNAEYGGVGSAGPNAFVASATEGQNYSLLIGVPLSDSKTLRGSYEAAYFAIPNNAVSSVRTAAFTLNADGNGSFGNVSVSGSAHNSGDAATTQTNSGVTYSFTGNGNGNISFGSSSSSQLLSGTKMFAISTDGNILLAGSPGDFDILFAVKSLPGAVTNSSFQGTYFMAGLWDNIPSATTPNGVTGLYGSATATSGGVALLHWRLNQTASPSPSTPFDYLFSTQYSDPASGGWTVGGGGQAVFAWADQGFYQFVVAVQAPSASGSGVVLNPVGIVNTATYSPITTPIAPLEMISLYGAGLSTGTFAASSYPLPIELNGTKVLLNGISAPLVRVSPTEIVAIVPGSIAPQTGQPDNSQWVEVQVFNNQVGSNIDMVRVTTASPGVFTAGANGIGQGAILHAADFSVVTSSHPAVPGETVLIYVTGLGAVRPMPADGAAASSTTLATVNANVFVGIDNIFVTPVFEGLAPGFAGLYQLNVVVPQTTHSGDVPLAVGIVGLSDATSATIPIAIPK